MVKKTVTILFCGLFCIGGINAYADTPLNKALDVQQQDKKVVKGTILDEMGEPIPGANKKECGNYTDMDLLSAKKTARTYLEQTLNRLSLDQLYYQNKK